MFKISREVILIVIIVILFQVDYIYAMNDLIKPEVEISSAGPMVWDDDGNGKRYNLVVVLSEVSLSIFIYEIGFGEENCCAKILNSFQVDPEKLEGKHLLFKVSDVKWLDFNKVQFVGNSTSYILKNLDGQHDIVRKNN